MINTLLFIHIVISLLLVVVILIQKTSTDGLSGLGSGSSNMGIVSGRSAANFLTKTTIVLAILFFISAITLGNMSSRSTKRISDKIEQTQNDENIGKSSENIKLEESLPMAK